MAARKTATKTKTGTKAASGTAAKAKSRIPRQEKCREEIKIAHSQVESGYVNLSKLLNEAYHKEFFIEWGFEDFRDYCGQELDVDYRKSMYLVDIYDKVKKLNLPVKEVNAIGWSKMKEIATVLDEKNAKEWLQKAKTMSFRELNEAVKIVRRGDGEKGAPVPQITTMSFKMSESEASIILDAIDEAKKLTESDNAVVALEMICQDWAESQGKTPTRASLQDHMAFLEGVFGVTLKATQKKKPAASKKEAKDTVGEAEKRQAAKKAPAKKKATAKKPNEDSISDDIDDLLGGDGDEDINDALGL